MGFIASPQRIARALSLSLLLTAVSLAPAMACQGKSVQFEDTFKTADPAWAPGPRSQIGNGSAQLTALPNSPFWTWYLGFVFETADICTDVSLKSGQPTSETAMGIMFWVADNSNFYIYSLYGDGTARVYRKVADRWLPVLFNQPAGVKIEPGKSVKLRVVIQGNDAKLSVAGKELGSIKGQPPAGGGAIGIYTQTEDPNKEAVAEFHDLKITSVP
jgi:hypothetical protein